MRRRFLLVPLSLLLAACPDEPGDPPGLIETEMVTLGVTMPDILDAIGLAEGFSQGPAVRVELPAAGEFIDITAAEVDLEATLDYVELTQTSGPAQGEIEATLRIGPYDDVGTVCGEGSPQTPATFAFDSTGITAADPPKIEANQDAIDAINGGGVSLCTDANSPIGGTISVSVVIFGLTVGIDCDDPNPADISGVWTGDYSCMDQCLGDDEPYETPGFVTMTVEQDGFYASYSDGEAEYTGVVCGNVFTYVGGAGDPLGTDYREFGRFTLNADGTGTKESRWRAGWCGGDCDDPVLTRQ